jgi:hypothetical protein
MKHISILVPESAVMEAVADPRYAFTAANQFLVAAGKQPLFQVQLVGNTPEVRLHEGAFSVHADKVWSEVSQTDLIIIPAFSGI